MLHKFRFVIGGALFLVASVVLNQAVSAHMPTALLPAGTTRYATATYTGPDSIEVSDGWVDLPGMTKYITIPGGHVADVMVTFCGLTEVTASAWANVRVLVRDAVASPTLYPLLSSNLDGSSQCALFYKTNVTAGSPAVKVQWMVSGSGTPLAIMEKRSMLVIVNIH